MTGATALGAYSDIRISVVMPVHNERDFVDAAVASILVQTHANFELVLCDDGSTDGSSEKLQAWTARDARVRVVRGEVPKGLARCGDWIVGEAREEIIARQDADDIAHPKRLERQLKALIEAPGAVLVGSLWQGIDRDGKPLRGRDRSLLARTDMKVPCGHGNAMFRKSAHAAVGGYRVACDFWEDVDFILRMARIGRVYYLPDALYLHRATQNSTRLRSDIDKVARAIELRFRCARAFAETGGYEPELAAAADTLVPSWRTFAALAAIRVGAGARPRLLRRMIADGRAGAAKSAAFALGYMLAGTIAPKALRALQNALVERRDRAHADNYRDGEPVEWHWSCVYGAQREAGSARQSTAHAAGQMAESLARDVQRPRGRVEPPVPRRHAEAGDIGH